MIEASTFILYLILEIYGVIINAIKIFVFNREEDNTLLYNNNS